MLCTLGLSDSRDSIHYRDSTEYYNNFSIIRPASGNEQASGNESSRVYCACVLSNSRHMFL